MTDDGAREPAGVTRVVAVDRAGCARVVGRLHAAHNRSVLGLEQGWLGEVVVMKISISRKVVCSRAGGAQGLWGSCPTSWNPREASQQRILGPRPQAAWGGGGGRGPVGQGGAREPRGRPEAASWVQHGQQTPCRATTAVDRAICFSQVADALESRTWPCMSRQSTAHTFFHMTSTYFTYLPILDAIPRRFHRPFPNFGRTCVS